MDLAVWRTFVAVCRLGSLSAVAAENHHTQSAVSRQIAGLERQLGVRLMERHARGVRLTPAGEVFHRHALATINEADRAVRAAQDAGAGAVDRALVIGATPSFAAGIVPEAVRALLTQVGPLRWSLLPGLSADLHVRVAEGHLDLAVVTDAPPGLPTDARVERRLLGLDEMVVVLPTDHPHVGRGPVHITALADQMWVEDNDGSAALLRHHAARAGVDARIGLSAVDLPGKLALVATGHAIALVPGVLRRALRADVAAIDLVDPPRRGIYTVTPRRAVHPRTGPLLEHLAAVFASVRSSRPAHSGDTADGLHGVPEGHNTTHP
ncbi:LysR family transcriptional regulator [Streptomyces sp. NPDC090127]|uniref:LysR family transcriptional regulator n=1 Tax=Streptomyces sp. NPDC090127 TaxID=3365953 RepID=UPI003811A6D2